MASRHRRAKRAEPRRFGSERARSAGKSDVCRPAHDKMVQDPVDSGNAPGETADVVVALIRFQDAFQADAVLDSSDNQRREPQARAAQQFAANVLSESLDLGIRARGRRVESNGSGGRFHRHFTPWQSGEHRGNREDAVSRRAIGNRIGGTPQDERVQTFANPVPRRRTCRRDRDCGPDRSEKVFRPGMSASRNQQSQLTLRRGRYGATPKSRFGRMDARERWTV